MSPLWIIAVLALIFGIPILKAIHLLIGFKTFLLLVFGVVVIIYIVRLWKRSWRKMFPPKCQHGVRSIDQPITCCAECVKEDEEEQKWRNGLRETQRKRDALKETLRLEQEQKKEEHRRRLQVEETERSHNRLRLQAEETEKIRHLSYLQSLDPIKFEQVVLQAFRNLGWQAEGTKTSNDGGIDGWLSKDGKRFILQCKRHCNSNRCNSRG